jgi:predicted dehydrogenase
MSTISRRSFVSSTAALLAGAPLVHASGQEQTISVGLIGCGGRGTGAAENCLESSRNVRLVAMADLFPERLEASRRQLSKRDGYKVDDANVFTGVNAYQRVLESGVDMVILTTPPGFRPLHFKAAVEAGKHVFFEKPVAVDPTGVRSVIEAGKLAKEKKLAVVAGTQRRHQKGYLETIARIHDGAIGDLVAGRAYWNGGGAFYNARKPGQSDMEYQLRNWVYYPWLSGDHIVEQHIHNLDVMNWVLKGHPVRATAVGGRTQRTEEKYGVIYDHFAVDFEYPDDVHVMSMCRHWNNTPGNISETVVGTKGRSDCHSVVRPSQGDPWQAPGGGINPYVQEHADLIASIRSGKLLNEAEQVAHSTLTAIMGREAAYTGKMIVWDELLKSPMSLVPETLALNAPPPEAKIPVPGKF